MSANVDQIWEQSAPVTTGETDAQVAAAETPATTDVSTDAQAAPVTSTEQSESPSSVEADKTAAAKDDTSETAVETKPDDFDPEKYVDPATKQPLPPDIKGRLAKTAEYQRGAKAYEAVKPVLAQLDDFGGLPALEETVQLRAALEAEDFPAFFSSLDSISQSKATAVKTAMIEAALADPDWLDVAVERATGKTLAEVKALVEGAAPQTPDEESDYDAEGNFVTPEARRIAKLEKELADIRAGSEATKQTEAQKAEAAKVQAQRIAVETATTEFIGETWKPVEAKAKAANLYPAEGDSPELRAIKEEVVKSLEEDLAKEFFEGATTKKFASLTLDYLARGERDTAFKRLEAAQRAAEGLADKYIERGTKRIQDHLELQALKLTPTARKDVVATAAAAPGNHVGTPAPKTNQTIDDIWGVDAERTRDALARAGV